MSILSGRALGWTSKSENSAAKTAAYRGCTVGDTLVSGHPSRPAVRMKNDRISMVTTRGRVSYSYGNARAAQSVRPGSDPS